MHHGAGKTAGGAAREGPETLDVFSDRHVPFRIQSVYEKSQDDSAFAAILCNDTISVIGHPVTVKTDIAGRKNGKGNPDKGNNQGTNQQKNTEPGFPAVVLRIFFRNGIQ